MKTLHLLGILLLTTMAMAVPPEETTARVRMAQWLTAQTGQTILPEELLMYPKTADLTGCQAAGLHGVGVHRSELRMHCPGMALPQLVVINRTTGEHASQTKTATLGPTIIRAKHTALVRSGAHLEAELRTDGMRALMPVVAMEDGDAGQTIRVKVPGNGRTMHANLVDAHSALIVNGGA
jgi:hypothetical protein